MRLIPKPASEIRTSSPQHFFSTFLSKENINRVFFTDGSLQSSVGDALSRVGYAVVSYNPELVHYAQIHDLSSIFDAEAARVLCALEYVEEFCFDVAAVATDSLSIIRCLESGDPRGVHPAIVYKIKELVYRLRSRGTRVKFV